LLAREGLNSVAVHGDLVAVVSQPADRRRKGTLELLDPDARTRARVEVGFGPDMVTFTPDGRRLLVANEGEGTADGAFDPDGSIGVVDLSAGPDAPAYRELSFGAFENARAELTRGGLHCVTPKATLAQDLEPEYVAVAPDGRRAFVTLQENNAVAVVDIASAKVLSIRPLGFKNHNVAGMGLDASDEDGGTNTNSGTPAIKIAPYPVKGMYLPDAIASYTFNGEVYLVTANEGDARADWPGFNEETRVRAHCDKGLDPAVFSDAANLILDSNLGRLRITTTPNGGSSGKNAAGQCNELFSFGARSFSIWNSSFTRVYDSGDQFEQRTQALPSVKFNASNDNDTLDARSPNKGPEPEGVVLGRIGAKTFAFIGLERVGGVMVFDVSNPTSPVYVTYFNSRNGATGDRGPEGLAFVPASKSPNGKPLLILANETSGSTAILQLNLTY